MSNETRSVAMALAATTLVLRELVAEGLQALDLGTDAVAMRAPAAGSSGATSLRTTPAAGLALGLLHVTPGPCFALKAMVPLRA